MKIKKPLLEESSIKKSSKPRKNAYQS